MFLNHPGLGIPLPDEATIVGRIRLIEEEAATLRKVLRLMDRADAAPPPVASKLLDKIREAVRAQG